MSASMGDRSRGPTDSLHKESSLGCIPPANPYDFPFCSMHLSKGDLLSPRPFAPREAAERGFIADSLSRACRWKFDEVIFVEGRHFNHGMEVLFVNGPNGPEGLVSNDRSANVACACQQDQTHRMQCR